MRSVVRYFLGKRGKNRVHGWRILYRMRLHMALFSSERVARIGKRTEVKLWVDGNEAFARLEKLLRKAKFSIVIQMFIWKDDKTGAGIAGLLVEMADRGVKVDVTKDTTGDVFEMEHDFLSTKHSKKGVWYRFWNHPNIHIAHVNEYDHTKAFVIDDHILLLSGMNIADEYRYDWHDYMVELRGSHFVQQYLTRESSTDTGESVKLTMNQGRGQTIRRSLSDVLREATSSIVVEHCYVSDQSILRILADKSHTGVRVTVILPRKADLHHNANMQAVDYLLQHADLDHLQVLLYPKIVHGKVVLVDKETAFVGSANLMTNSLDSMGEANVLIHGKHKRALQKLRLVLRKDIFKSKPILHPPRLHWIGRWLALLGL